MENLFFLNNQSQELISQLKIRQIKYVKHNHSLLCPNIRLFMLDLIQLHELFEQWPQHFYIEKNRVKPKQFLVITVKLDDYQIFNEVFNQQKDIFAKQMLIDQGTQFLRMFFFSEVAKTITMPLQQNLSYTVNILDQQKYSFANLEHFTFSTFDYQLVQNEEYITKQLFQTSDLLTKLSINNGEIILQFFGDDQLSQIQQFYKKFMDNSIKSSIMIEDKQLVEDLYEEENLLINRLGEEITNLSAKISKDINIGKFGLKIEVTSTNIEYINQNIFKYFNGKIFGAIERIMVQQFGYQVVPGNQQNNTQENVQKQAVEMNQNGQQPLNHKNKNNSRNKKQQSLIQNQEVEVILKKVDKVEEIIPEIMLVPIKIVAETVKPLIVNQKPKHYEKLLKSERVDIATKLLQHRRRLIFVSGPNVSQLQNRDWYKNLQQIHSKEGILFNTSVDEYIVFMQKGIKFIDDIICEII